MNIGLIGLGVISQYAHIPAYKYKNLNLIGVADLDKNAVEKTKEKWGIPIATQDPDEIINNPNIDINIYSHILLFYNRICLHPFLNYKSPEEYKK